MTDKNIVPQNTGQHKPQLTFKLFKQGKAAVNETQRWTAGAVVILWDGIVDGKACVAQLQNAANIVNLVWLVDGHAAATVRATRLNLCSGPYWPFLLDQSEYIQWAAAALAALGKGG